MNLWQATALTLIIIFAVCRSTYTYIPIPVVIQHFLNFFIIKLCSINGCPHLVNINHHFNLYTS